jgi:hypothetical protein
MFSISALRNIGLSHRLEIHHNFLGPWAQGEPPCRLGQPLT